MVSVIVPVYNVEKYLPRCVDSILQQTFQDFELILVDDESPDRCPQMCEEWAAKDGRIKVIHKKNGGVSAARNSGLEIAKGAYIAFCDSDDYWESTFLERLYRTAERGSHDVVSCGICYTNSVGEKKKLFSQEFEIEFQDDVARQRYLHERLLGGEDGWSNACRLFRAELIQKHNIRFCTECNNFAEDMGFVSKCVLYSNSIASIDSCLYNYIWYPASMMTSTQEVIRLDDMNQVSYYLGAEYRPEKMGKRWAQYRAVSHYLIMYNQYKRMFLQEREKELPEMLRSMTRQAWFRENTKGLFKARKLLISYFGKDDTRRILIFSAYCLHKSWAIYRITRAVNNRIFGYRRN